MERARVFVVDDDALLRESLSHLLETQGYQVRECENGAQALALLRTGHAADLILLDLMMPEMNGWEFRAAQLRDAQLATIPVIALSADGSPQALTMNARRYLTKPVDARAVLTAVEEILSDSTQAEEL